MLDTNERIALAGKFATQANKVWCSHNRELLASFHLPSLWKALGAWLQLEMRAELENTDPSLVAYEAIISRGFVTLLDEGSITPAAEISKLGMADLDRLRRSTGLGAEALPEPERVLSVEEKLEQQIIADWNSLPGDQIRKKRDSSRAYRDALARLLETDKLSPHASVKVTF
jgi:hypothetical protein